MKKNNKTACQISTEQISQVLEIANKHKVKRTPMKLIFPVHECPPRERQEAQTTVIWPEVTSATLEETYCSADIIPSTKNGQSLQIPHF